MQGTMNNSETAIWKSDGQILRENIRLIQENRRLLARLEEAEVEANRLRGSIRANVREHMRYYERRRRAKDIVNDVCAAGKVFAGTIILTAILWNVFVWAWNLGASGL